MITNESNEIETRLLLRAAVTFEFGALLDGCGTYLRVTHEGGDGEGAIVLRHYNNPWLDLIDDDVPAEMKPAVLVQRQEAGDHGLYWIPWDPRISTPEGFFVVRREEEREAIRLALRIADGHTKVKDLTEKLKRPTAEAST